MDTVEDRITLLGNSTHRGALTSSFYKTQNKIILDLSRSKRYEYDIVITIQGILAYLLRQMRIVVTVNGTPINIRAAMVESSVSAWIQLKLQKAD